MLQLQELFEQVNRENSSLDASTLSMIKISDINSCKDEEILKIFPFEEAIYILLNSPKGSLQIQLMMILNAISHKLKERFPVSFFENQEVISMFFAFFSYGSQYKRVTGMLLYDMCNISQQIRSFLMANDFGNAIVLSQKPFAKYIDIFLLLLDDETLPIAINIFNYYMKELIDLPQSSNSIELAKTILLGSKIIGNLNINGPESVNIIDTFNFNNIDINRLLDTGLRDVCTNVCEFLINVGNAEQIFSLPLNNYLYNDKVIDLHENMILRTDTVLKLLANQHALFNEYEEDYSEEEKKIFEFVIHVVISCKIDFPCLNELVMLILSYGFETLIGAELDANVNERVLDLLGKCANDDEFSVQCFEYIIGFIQHFITKGEGETFVREYQSVIDDLMPCAEECLSSSIQEISNAAGIFIQTVESL